MVLVVAGVLVIAATVVVGVRVTGGPAGAADTPDRATARSASASASASPTSPPTSSCRPTGPALRVVAASGIADVVRAAARAECLSVDVSVDDSERAAAGLRAGTADVWIPDSRTRGYLAIGATVATAPSLATSPLVLVASPQVAAMIGRGAPVSWALLLDQAALAPLTAAVEDPAVSGATLVLAGALSAVGTAASGGNQNTGVAAAARAIHSLASVPAALISPSATRLDIVEQRFAAGVPDVVQVPMAEGLPYLDYPFVTLPAGAAPAATTTAPAAAALLAALRGPAAERARADAHLLAPGATSAELSPSTAVDLLPPIAVAAIPTSIAVANTGASSASVLAVLDVSGSMADAAPGQQPPIDVVRQSAQTFFTTFGQGVDLGLWEFGYQLAPPSDHVEIFPIQPFASSKALLGPAIAAVQARRSGTALYRTTLDAYRAVQDAWKPDSANLVVVFTDGRDEDAPGSLGLPSLLTTLRTETDPRRPVQVVFFGYGNADLAAMTAITKVVGGGVYPIASSTDIVGAFIRASGQIAASAG